MVYWAVARLGGTPGEVLLEDGYVDGDDAAVAQIADVGTRLATGASAATWVTLGSTNVLVPAFGDAATDRAALQANIRLCVVQAYESQRTASIKQMIWNESHVRAAVHATPAGSVRDQWARITGWIGTHLPDAAFAGADNSSTVDAMAATGQVWPAELVELFTLINGIPSESRISLLPRHRLLALDEVVEEHESTIRIWNETALTYGGEVAIPPPLAGFQADTFIPGFVPFAALDSNFLVVDSRPGPMNGCVTEFDKTGADERGPQWVSISAMLTDLADSLTVPQEFDEGWSWSAESGVLEWEWDRSSTLRRVMLSTPADAPVDQDG